MSRRGLRIFTFRLIFTVCFLLSSDLYAFNGTHNEHFENAKRYLHVQQQEKAIESFLRSLHPNPPIKDYFSSVKEKILYQKALALYFDAKSVKFFSLTDQIITEYAPIVEKHPEYAELAFIVASAYANRGEFSHLFDLFYKAYYQHPHHYFSYKTQAILWIKLFERTLPGELKEKRRDHILKFLSLASDAKPTDTTLYRLLMLYAPEEMHSKVVAESLNKIIRDNLILSIGELEFYIEMAFDLNENSLIRRFIDKASEWYPNSRILARAQLELAAKN
ncbi:MAG: hypothetical protein H0W50_01435 [Parachlamydiaceae bacterium]|nr:hypothetical protein [Parachlamydiaceae bacterium]